MAYKIIVISYRKNGNEFAEYVVFNNDNTIKAISPRKFWFLKLENQTNERVYKFLYREHLSKQSMRERVEANMALQGRDYTYKELYLEIVNMKYSLKEGIIC